jgi:hypothetical protein
MNAEFVAVGYCGKCDLAHVQLFDNEERMVAQGVVDRGAAVELANELLRYARDGVRQSGPLNTMLFPIAEEQHG